ncbi:MAG: hypothetical protein BWX78_01573 [Firmicutes bacterium ADurb.Bin099]|jgi:hypothetical protein|nr:MAG: hypothetical protein BWX78_01573 [Firmicutes bacterium ADurb.Bin099]
MKKAIAIILAAILVLSLILTMILQSGVLYR